MTCETLQGLVGLYALGALDEALLLELDAHLDGCHSCWASFAELRQVVGVVAYGLEMPPLSSHVKDRLFSRIDRLPARQENRVTRAMPVADPVWLGLGREPVTPPDRRHTWILAIGLALALLVAGYQSYLAGLARSEQEAAVTLLAHQHTLLERSNRVVRQLRQEKQDLSQLKARDVQIVSLSGQRKQPGAFAQLVWNRQENSWLLSAERLEPAPAKQAFQLWAVTARSKYTLGTFQTHRGGKGQLKAFLPNMDGKPVAALVTLEPAAGVTQPTGDLMLMGLL